MYGDWEAGSVWVWANNFYRDVLRFSDATKSKAKGGKL
jgi:hypothetical protein